MSTSIALVQKSEATRYPPEMRETAYLLWRTTCGRSARKVSQRLGITDVTISNWARSGSWIERANQEDTDDYQSSRMGVVAVVVNQLVPNIETAISIRDDKTVSARDRLAAAQWLAGLAGVSPVSKIESAVTDNRGTTIEVMPDFDTMQIEEIRAYELSKRPKRSTG